MRIGRERAHVSFRANCNTSGTVYRSIVACGRAPYWMYRGERCSVLVLLYLLEYFVVLGKNRNNCVASRKNQQWFLPTDLSTRSAFSENQKNINCSTNLNRRDTYITLFCYVDS